MDSLLSNVYFSSHPEGGPRRKTPQEFSRLLI